jgi:hypothetical protein
MEVDVDVADKNSKERARCRRTCGIYTANDGKIAREEFLPYAGNEK